MGICVGKKINTITVFTFYLHVVKTAQYNNTYNVSAMLQTHASMCVSNKNPIEREKVHNTGIITFPTLAESKLAENHCRN
jgi:hypothetical protein